MKYLFYRLAGLVLCLMLLWDGIPGARAAETAQDITPMITVAGYQGMEDPDALFDGDRFSPATSADGASLILNAWQGIGSCYLIFDDPCGICSVTDNATGEKAVFGQEGFLHSFVDLEAAFGYAPASVTFRFASGGGRLNELTLFSSGQVPDYVQKWETGADGNTDLLLFSTHGDDEHLFFGGILPTYAGQRKYQVRVAYLTGHPKDPVRRHEMLDGLWAVGMRNYPSFGPFGDHYCSSMKSAYKNHEKEGETEAAMLSYVVEQLRRYKPLVAIGHDIQNGEYGHGQHMMYADLLCRALEAAKDPAQFPASSQEWGTWDVPKTYLHLWPENEIVMDWDIPLERFDGMTAYQASKDLGFTCHVSQYKEFVWYFYGRDKAAELFKYSPCEFGLYRSTVGIDRRKDDFFENLRPYASIPVQSALREGQVVN